MLDCYGKNIKLNISPSLNLKIHVLFWAFNKGWTAVASHTDSLQLLHSIITLNKQKCENISPNLAIICTQTINNQLYYSKLAYKQTYNSKTKFLPNQQ